VTEGRNDGEFFPHPSASADRNRHIFIKQPLWRHLLFKVQVNFDIPVFEGQIDVEAQDKWLNLLEGYFSIQNFSDREKITFTLLKYLPHVKHWWETYWEQSSTEESRI
jgi:hypothetical protein